MGEKSQLEKESSSSTKKNRAKKTAIGACVVIVVLGIAGAAFWTWHEKPSFCGAICHTPMDPYLAAYEQDSGSRGVDKWGNDVEDTSSMIAVTHSGYEDNSGEDIACLSCHTPVLAEQVSEGFAWAAGNYSYPLTETTLTDLTAARGSDADGFCLNDECHAQNHKELLKTTSEFAKNPHTFETGEDHFGRTFDCGMCHKAHRASVYVCTECHVDAVEDTPESWLTYQEAYGLASQYAE